MRTPLLQPRFFLPFCLLVAFAIGAFFRLDQVLAQVLEGDEWHPVHQLTYYTPRQIISSFGHADYSIPLVLFYWLQMKLFGVSEMTLRLPMIVAGLLTVIALPMGLRNRLNDRIVALFALLLAISPFLIYYTRIARPYAVTLLGIYAAFWCLERAIENHRIRWISAVCYALFCGLVIWTHAITGPMLIAPLIALWWAAWRGKGPAWRPLITLTGLVCAMMALAVLPPLLCDPGALAGKVGVDSITLATFYGALFLWFGNGSLAFVIVCVIFALVGWATIWRTIPIVRWISLGVLLTVLALFIIRPWWVDRPLAFGRYLLPAVPLLLLAVSSGIVRVSDGLKNAAGKIGGNWLWTFAITTLFLAGCWISSPLPDILHHPNSYTQHPYFQYNYRKELNPVRIYMPKLPASSFWANLSTAPPASLRIAVAPFRYATYEWPSPIWERNSRQRVVPAYLWGACESSRHGEVPPDARFRFRNAVHVKDKDTLLAQGIDYLAYYRPLPLKGWSPPLPHCESWVREHYGPPDYEDTELLVWQIRPGKLHPSIER